MVPSPKAASRLPFILPEFTRIVWVSESVRATWEPRISHISNAWWQVEWLSVYKGLRACSLTQLKPDSFIKASTLWAHKGLSVLPLQIEGASKQSYISVTQPPKIGEAFAFRVAVGKLENLVQFEQAWGRSDKVAIGHLLGYPSCCRTFFQDVWVSQQWLDTTWPMALNTVKSAKDTTCIHVAGPPVANILWRWMGVRNVPHLPCSFSCAESIQLGETFLQVGREAGFEREMGWIEDILSWPVEWSSLHGIAEIKTPILKVSTRTDAMPSKYTVSFQGRAFPSEGATGLRFPYQTPRHRFITGSLGFQRGLENSKTHSDVTHTAWYYQDNGFSSRKAMDAAHAPLVKLAQGALAGKEGCLLDLGCGNGALLKKICHDRDVLLPFGIDISEQCIDHAKILLPQFRENFYLGNIFDLHQWLRRKRSFILAILMIGRLLEVDENKAKQLMTVLEARCNRVLVYLYPDWQAINFHDTIKKFGMRVQTICDEAAALVTFEGKMGHS